MTSIRPATPADLPALLALEAVAFGSEDRFSRRNIRHLLGSPSAGILLCEVAGETAGSAILLFRSSSKIARLYSIATHPEHTRKGVGAELIAACQAESLRRGCDRLRLEVRARNLRAQTLYLNCGFRLLKAKKDYYANGETALVLERDLKTG
jgi:[ribosomal protein S18]-alanine N-acetyltransferase